MGSELLNKFNVDDALDCIDVRFSNYGTPSVEALEFFNLMRIVFGKDFEVDSPRWHYFLVDCLLGNIKAEQFPYSDEINRNLTVDPSAIAVIAARGLAKSTITSLFYPIYASVKGCTPVTGDLSHILILSDSQQGGSRDQALLMGNTLKASKFANQWFEKIRGTESEVELIRANQGSDKLPIEKRHMLIKFKGAQSGGIRSGSRNAVTGDRYGLLLCHKKGTMVTTDMGTHKVEDYYNVLGERKDYGLNIKLCGLPDTECVTKEHKYWARLYSTKQIWDTKAKKLVTVTDCEEPRWVEAKDLTRDYMIGSPIKNKEILDLPTATVNIGFTKKLVGNTYVSGVYSQKKPIDLFEHDDFWFLFGLWLADGTKSKHSIAIALGFTNIKKIAKKRITTFLDSIGKKYSVQPRKDACEVIVFSHTQLSNWLTENVSLGYQGGKKIPDFIYNFSDNNVCNVISGYLHGDGFIDLKGNKGGQIRANSVCPELIYGIGKLCEIVDLPYHIRYARSKPILTVIKGRECISKPQLEIRLKDNVKKLLGFSIEDGEQQKTTVKIENGYIWRRVLSNEPTEGEETFVPIQTPDHTYTTIFGLSHNCDDVVKNEAEAYSETIMKNVRTALESDAENAMRGSNTQMVLINTPFHKFDPVYKALEGGAYTPIVVPIAKEVNETVTKSKFVSTWEEMHPYESVMKRYKKALGNGSTGSFNKELMLRVASDTDRLITDDMIQWYDRNLVIKLLDGYSLYMTTDFTTTSSATSDFSAIGLWAVSSNMDYFLLDLCLRRQELQSQYDEVFRMIGTWSRGGRYIEVGVETDGQQQAHIFTLKEMMIKRNQYFSFAKQKGASPSQEGIKSARAAGSKLDRFRYMLPHFQNKKMWFPEQLKEDNEMKEAIKQLKGVTHSGFTNKDDFNDVVSQLGLIDVRPGTDISGGVDVNDETSPFYGLYDDDDEFISNTIF